jgi:hypothetical protein
LKEELSQAQTDHFIDVIRFGQWKLQVEQLAEENGWELPELSDSATLVVPGPKIEGHLEAEVEATPSWFGTFRQRWLKNKVPLLP